MEHNKWTREFFVIIHQNEFIMVWLLSSSFAVPKKPKVFSDVIEACFKRMVINIFVFGD